MHRRLLAVVAIATLLSASGCSSAVAPGAEPPGGAPPAASADDLAVVAEVYRTRSDPARGGIQLAVRNEGDDPLRVVRVSLESPALAEALQRDRAIEIGPGLTRDLALILTAPRCPAESGIAPEAVIVVELADGSTTELRLPTTDRIGQWAAWLDEQCFAVAAADRAEITVQRDPAADTGDRIGLVLRADARATGLELIAVNDTVLFGMVRADDGSRVTSQALPGPLAVGQAVSIPLLLTPARCDAHALADDKQGTLFRVDITLDGTPGTVTIAADAATRGSLYDAFRRACGL